MYPQDTPIIYTYFYLHISQFHNIGGQTGSSLSKYLPTLLSFYFNYPQTWLALLITLKTLFGILPPHSTGTSILNIPKIGLSEELIPVPNHIYEDERPENAHTVHYWTDIILGSFAFHHVNQIAAKARIIKAPELGYIYLWRA